jgi:hypothetical protein
LANTLAASRSRRQEKQTRCARPTLGMTYAQRRRDLCRFLCSRDRWKQSARTCDHTNSFSWNGRFVMLGASRDVPCGSTREADRPDNSRPSALCRPGGAGQRLATENSLCGRNDPLNPPHPGAGSPSPGEGSAHAPAGISAGAQGLPSEGPFVSDQFPVPAKDRRGPDEEGGLKLAREQAGCRGQQGSVRAPQVRTTGLPGKNLQLVTKNEDLDLALPALLPRWHEAKEAP